ncbi:MAG: S1 family peptidase [Myxococcales bacterium]|nr:S1 family peptidase [Myxococcales bacterium]
MHPGGRGASAIVAMSGAVALFTCLPAFDAHVARAAPSAASADGGDDSRGDGDEGHGIVGGALDDAPLPGVSEEATEGGATHGPTLDAVVALANTRGLVCTGTLVARDVVLTARHCLPIVNVRVGADPRRPRETARVLRAETMGANAVDVAALVLDRALAAPPIALRRDDRALPRHVWLVGFGATDPRGLRGMGLRHRAMVPLRDLDCSPSESNRYGCSGVELVIPRSNGADTCAGDSGGPVLEVVGGKPRVVAVTSRVVRGALVACGDGGIYTRADAIAPWLDGVLKKERGR